ncbi:hypothetical protein [Nonomuraea sp. NPDC049695]|uniref:hypothetical protein n=1 Tax=Nonomuraea sp. NPDC049695 TaxID=3154734 RepID=UPI00342272AB
MFLLVFVKVAPFSYQKYGIFKCGFGQDPLAERACRDPLTAAILAGRWIRSAAVDDEGGRRWRANPDARDGSALAVAEPASLYAGATGMVLFLRDEDNPINQ